MSIISRPLTLALPLLLAAAAPALAIITLDDPLNFQVKNTFSGDSLGVPGPLGGLLFSPDGSVLYVVGASENPGSALYAVPVTRDPATNAVTGLGPAASVTKVLDGNSVTYGLDAGLEVGPAGTLFYTYWPANQLGERPIGARQEQLFPMAPVGVPASIAGLTFSPHRIDPATGFGRMQISSWQSTGLQSANIYEVPLTPDGRGIFTPGTVAFFVTLPREGTGAIQYAPSGPLAGNLMYVNYNFGEVRLLAIDTASGLPIDKGTGQPTLGTTNPTDSRFASGLGIGPWGLEFDPLTNDFLVATFRGDPANSIVQIGGAGFPPPTTTTSITTTTTSVAPTTTTTRPSCGDGQVDTAGGEQCDAGPANGAPGSCCDASCRIVAAGAVCRVAPAACDTDAICDGAGSTCPANGKKADAEPCDDSNPATGTSACRSDACEGVAVTLQIPTAVDLPAGTSPKQLGVPVSIEIGGKGRRPALVVIQGFTTCSEVPPPLSDCTSKVCRLIRKALLRSCVQRSVVSALAAAGPPAGTLVVTRTLKKKVGRSTRPVQGTLRLNRLGRSLLQQSTTLPLESRAAIRDRGGSTLTALFRTLLRLR